MALMSDVELPVIHVREQIAGALDLIVHMTRLADGRRTVARISAVEGLRGGSILLQDIFTWRRGPHPGFHTTGSMSSIMRLLAERDERIDPRVFSELSVSTIPSDKGGEPAPTTIPTPRPSTASGGSWPSCGSWPGSLRSLGAVLE
jgi:hypothetical protein